MSRAVFLSVRLPERVFSRLARCGRRCAAVLYFWNLLKQLISLQRELRTCADILRALFTAEQVPPEELEFRGDPDNRKDVMANRKRIQVPLCGAV